MERNRLIKAIDEANALGYAVKIKNEFNQKRVTCIYKDNTSHSQVVPFDHLTDDYVASIIEYIVKKHKEWTVKQI